MNRLLLVVASWEPRFRLGVERMLAGGEIAAVCVIFSMRSKSRTAYNREMVQAECLARGVEYEEWEVDFEAQVPSYLGIEGILEGKKNWELVTFDISTSPRDISLMVLRRLMSRWSTVKVIYSTPSSYAQWLSKEAGVPRLVLGSSGVMYPDKTTAVIAFCANSLGRVEQLCNYMEPSRVILLWEKERKIYGKQDVLPDVMRGITEPIEFDHKDFSVENVQKIERMVEGAIGENNVLLIATGPKIGMVHVFNMVTKYPEAAAAYIPSKYYNDEYSSGLGATLTIDIYRQEHMGG